MENFVMKSGRKKYQTDCLENEVFISALLKKGSLEEKERLIDHILVCQKCKLKFAALKQISNQLGTFTEGFEGKKFTAGEEEEFRKMARQRINELSKKPKVPFWRSLPVRYLVTAAAGLLIVIAGYFLVIKLQQREVYREGERGEFRLIEPVGVITEVPSVFSWTYHGDADNYFLRLIDDELNIVLTKSIVRTKDVYEPKATLSEDEKKKLNRGKTYIWEVEARNVFHKVITSDRKHFEIKER
jgi:hypothetical protein